MNRYIKGIFSFSLFALSSMLFAQDFAEIRIARPKGAISSERVAMEKMPDGALRVRVPKSKIDKKIVYIDVVADFARAKKGDAGYWVFSRGQLGTFKYDNGISTDNNRYMPVFGMKKDEGSWVGIIAGMDMEYRLYSQTIDGKTELFPRFDIARLNKGTGFGAYEDIVVDYYKLPAEAGYSDMARLYRNYRLKRGEIKPLAERTKASPQLAYDADTFLIRFHYHAGKPSIVNGDVKPEDEAKPLVHLSFDDAVKYMEKLKAAGIEKIDICSAGWESGGYDGRNPENFPVCEEAGGEAGLQRMLAVAKRLGYQIGPHTAYMPAVKVSPRWDEKYIARDSDGNFVRHMSQRGGKAYRISLPLVVDKWAKPDIDKIKEEGFNGMLYIDVFSSLRPHDDMSPKHPATRKDIARAQNEILEYGRKILGGCGSESGLDHVMGNLDYINYVSWLMQDMDKPKAKEGKDKRFQTTDKIVPFWEIVYHGIVLYNPDRITQNHTRGGGAFVGGQSSMIKQSDGIVREAPFESLKLVEFGGRPIFYTHSDIDIPAIKKAYDDYMPLKYLQKYFMESHEEIAKDIYLVKYSDGSEIVCNYSAKPFTYKGGTVPSMGYFLTKP